MTACDRYDCNARFGLADTEGITAKAVCLSGTHAGDFVISFVPVIMTNQGSITFDSFYF